MADTIIPESGVAEAGALAPPQAILTSSASASAPAPSSPEFIVAPASIGYANAAHVESIVPRQPEALNLRADPVRYDMAQSLTETQKETARSNIGAVSKAQLDQKANKYIIGLPIRNLNGELVYDIDHSLKLADPAIAQVSEGEVFILINEWSLNGHDFVAGQRFQMQAGSLIPLSPSAPRGYAELKTASASNASEIAALKAKDFIENGTEVSFGDCDLDGTLTARQGVVSDGVIKTHATPSADDADAVLPQHLLAPRLLHPLSGTPVNDWYASSNAIAATTNGLPQIQHNAVSPSGANAILKGTTLFGSSWNAVSGGQRVTLFDFQVSLDSLTGATPNQCVALIGRGDLDPANIAANDPLEGKWGYGLRIRRSSSHNHSFEAYAGASYHLLGTAWSAFAQTGFRAIFIESEGSVTFKLYQRPSAGASVGFASAPLYEGVIHNAHVGRSNQPTDKLVVGALLLEDRMSSPKLYAFVKIHQALLF